MDRQTGARKENESEICSQAELGAGASVLNTVVFVCFVSCLVRGFGLAWEVGVWPERRVPCVGSAWGMRC